VNTDLICPDPMMHLPLDQIGQAAMAGIDPNFHKRVSYRDIIVAGRNFGCGSSRELAPIALKSCDIGAIIAEYFARIFFRNCIAIGLPILECRGISKVSERDVLTINLLSGVIENLTKKEKYYGMRHPNFLDILKAGNIISWIKDIKTVPWSF
jgi:3-isopropylmalate/(R)-2-methylmalate dehydratase small subunit